MYEINFNETFKIFLITYCHLKKAGYYRMPIKNILFTFDMNQLIVATQQRLRFANQLHIMSLRFSIILVLTMFFVDQLWAKYLFYMIDKNI